jgi:hypothetical protein
LIINTVLLNKTIDGNHIAWFEQGNQWIIFEEPAWFVYTLSVKGTGTEKIISRCKKKYGAGEDESRQFVEEILGKLAEYEASPSAVTPRATAGGEAFFLATPCFTRSYLINNKPITISYEAEWLVDSVHPLIAHLESDSQSVCGTLFELFIKYDQFGIRVTRPGQTKTWFFDQADLQKGRLFIEVLNTVYSRQEDDWMTIIHGSAVTNGTDTLIFSSACGGGKSTLATLLQANGLQVVTDDMVPVEAKTGRIYPFPAALSVKAGAIDMLLPFYPELEHAPVFDFPSLNKQVRYLPLHHSFQDKKLINKAKTLIFVSYDASVDLLLEEVPKIEAIKLFNQEAWVSSTPENARRYINWIIKMPCYKLTYSDNVKAVECVMGLFL